ncbi:SHOCT domain-containing protein [Kitasatospora griseola]|uniref:SHOCT domain-containing protein n=1 Tax=Kitasatospora griseola TaxID=2064 RepID=UPI0037F9CA8B
MMYWNGSDMGGWGFGLMALTALLFLGLLGTAVVVLVRRLGGSADPGPAGRRPEPEPRPEPEQLLAERLARGDIDPDEYRRTLEALRPAGERTGRRRTS